ncbi:MAG TPA: hypothetical protein VMV99_10845 [Rhodanobacter sp.]|nr:hypothetical protein [Rhodanobacter sp.]
MTSQLCTLLAGCILATIFGTSTARAANGRIVFSGAVVAPTCVASEAHIGAATTAQPGQNQTSGQFVCGNAGAAADAGRAYSVTVASLDSTTLPHDRLLGYFSGYANASGVDGIKARLVTQTFE